MEEIIRDQLLERIVSSYYVWGELFPSENNLAQEFQVSRMVIRRVLNVLEEMGYIFSIKGKGRFLRKQQQKIPLNLNGEESFTDKMEEAGLDLTTHSISGPVLVESNQIYKALKAKPSERIFRIERLRILDGTPAAIHISYLRETQFPDIAQKGDSISSLYQYFREKGYLKFYSPESIMSISLPTLDEQHTLGCPPLVPLLVLESETFEEDSDQLLQFTRILYRSDRFQYITR